MHLLTTGGMDVSTARRSTTGADPPERLETARPSDTAETREDFDGERERRELAQRRAVFVARRARETATTQTRALADRRSSVANRDEARRVRAWWAAVTVSRPRSR
jgi:hypothetical protein